MLCTEDENPEEPYLPTSRTHVEWKPGPLKEGDRSGTDRAGKLINDVPENSFSVENIKSS